MAHQLPPLPYGYDALPISIVEVDDDSAHPLLSKRDEHAPTDDGHGIFTSAIGEDHVQRHGQRDVAEFRHGLEEAI